MTSILRLLTVPAALCCILTCAGCKSEGPIAGESITGDRVVSERDTQFVVLDKALKKKFSFENPVQRRIENDRLEVVVEIRNRTNHAQNVDVSTVFRDEANNAVGDETAWTRLIFGPNQSQTYRATSLNNKAAKFAVRVREGR